MSKRLTVNILTSASIHFLSFAVILSLGGSGLFSGKKEESGDSSRKFGGVKAENIITKEKPVEVSLVEKKLNEGDVLVKMPTPTPKLTVDVDKECPGDWYGGIGIQNNYNKNGEQIAIIFSGYPADLAGLKVGDIITAISDKEITGVVGTPITLKILRNGSYFDITIIRGKVCYGQVEP